MKRTHPAGRVPDVTISLEGWGLPEPQELVRRMRSDASPVPTSVSDAWYAAECPPKMRMFGRVPHSDYIAWRLSCLLRRTRRAG